MSAARRSLFLLALIASLSNPAVRPGQLRGASGHSRCRPSAGDGGHRRRCVVRDQRRDGRGRCRGAPSERWRGQADAGARQPDQLLRGHVQCRGRYSVSPVDARPRAEQSLTRGGLPRFGAQAVTGRSRRGPMRPAAGPQARCLSGPRAGPARRAPRQSRRAPRPPAGARPCCCHAGPRSVRRPRDSSDTTGLRARAHRETRRPARQRSGPWRVGHRWPRADQRVAMLLSL